MILSVQNLFSFSIFDNLRDLQVLEKPVVFFAWLDNCLGISTNKQSWNWMRQMIGELMWWGIGLKDLQNKRSSWMPDYIRSLSWMRQIVWQLGLSRHFVWSSVIIHQPQDLFCHAMTLLRSSMQSKVDVRFWGSLNLMTSRF